MENRKHIKRFNEAQKEDDIYRLYDFVKNEIVISGTLDEVKKTIIQMGNNDKTNDCIATLTDENDINDVLMVNRRLPYMHFIVYRGPLSWVRKYFNCKV